MIAGNVPVLVHNEGWNPGNPWSNAQEWKNGWIPRTGCPANGIYYKTDPGSDGAITGWGVYDENGNLAYRVDLFEAVHGGVETPHWQPYQVNVNPKTGKTYVNPTGDAFPGVGPAGEPPFGC